MSQYGDRYGQQTDVATATGLNNGTPVDGTVTVGYAPVASKVCGVVLLVTSCDLFDFILQCRCDCC